MAKTRAQQTWDHVNRSTHQSAESRKDYELITGVFQVHSQRSDRGEVLCVPQRCKLYSNLSRGAAIPKIISAVAGRYGVDSSQVKFWFWATGVSIPGNDVLCQFESDQVVTAKY